MTSQRRFSLFDRCLFTPFLHGEISLLSLHPWIPPIDINKSYPSFRMIWTFLKNPKIILIDFCKQLNLKPTITARKWKLEFIFAGFFVVRYLSADASVFSSFHNKNKLWFFEKNLVNFFIRVLDKKKSDWFALNQRSVTRWICCLCTE